MTWSVELLQAASAGVGVELKTLRQQRDGLEDQIQRLEASIARAKGRLYFFGNHATFMPRSCACTASAFTDAGQSRYAWQSCSMMRA